MKLKQAMTGIAALACVTAAHAQSAGSFYVTTGWFHFAPQTSSDPLQFTGGPLKGYSIPGSAATLSDADTLGFTAGYFITDHIATEFVIGVPPKFDLDGAGSLGAYGKLGDARQWSPTLLFKYYFNSPQAKIRPFLGVGVSRIWFTNEEVTSAGLQAPLAMGGLGGPTTVKADSSWSPVFNAGFNFNITDHWFAGFSLSYLPFSTTARLNTTIAPGVTSQSQTKMRLDPIVTYLNVGYRF